MSIRVRNVFEINIISGQGLPYQWGLPPIAMLTRIAPSVLNSYEIYVTNGSCTKRRSSCAWAYEKSIKISFYSSKSAGFPSPGGAIRSIGRSDPPITDGHEVGAPVCECLALTLKCPVYLNLRARRYIHTPSLECR